MGSAVSVLQPITTVSLFSNSVNMLLDKQSTFPLIWKSDYLLEQKWLKNIYKKGHWAANFKDSSIQISFGDNQFSLQTIVGKYTSLGSSEMTIKQDEVKGKMRKTYLSFEHY